MPEFNLTRYCLEAATRDGPARTAFTFLFNDRPVQAWTFAQVLAQVESRARGFVAAGLEPRERVLICLDHSPEYAFSFFAAVLAGLVPVPVSPALTAEEVEFLVGDARPAAAVAPASQHPAGIPVAWSPEEMVSLDADAALPATDAEDPAFLIYTSGTTARPKGVLHAHRTVLGRALMRDAWQGFGAGDAVMHAGALNWSYTLGVGLMDTWAAGATAVLAERPEEAGTWLERIRDHEVNVFVAVPTVYRQALKYGNPDIAVPSLRHVLCAGEPLAPALYHEWRERFGVEMYESLGMTEISTYISSGPATPVRPGSPGRPQPGRHVAILPGGTDSTTPEPPGVVGMLAVHRGDPGLMLGYWDRPDEEALVYRGEWFTGGDLASMDEDGYVWFQGRADDMVKSFGYRISPVEVEAALEAHPSVAEVAVTGHAADPQKTILVAHVVPAPGVAVSAIELEEHARLHLASYKRPREYRIVESLPRTPNGKLQRNRLL